MFENAKIRNRINSYTKADLMNYAGDLQLKKYSKLNKEELVDAIVANLLDPDVMFYRMSIYDDKTIELFERGMGNPCEVTDDEFDTACIFNEIPLDSLLCGLSSFLPLLYAQLSGDRYQSRDTG